MGQTTTAIATNARIQPQQVRPESTRVDTKKSIMVGLAKGCCRKEAWTGGKPNCLWTGLEHPHAIDFVQPTQMQSNSAKAAADHLKCTQGIFLNKACRFKTGEDLDDMCTRLKTHIKKHGMDVVASRHNPNNTSKMALVFNSHTLFTIKSVKTCNLNLIFECDTHDEQNKENAIKCFVNSLGEDPGQQI